MITNDQISRLNILLKERFPVALCYILMENWTWNINLFSSSFFRNETSLVNLQLLRNNKKVEQVVYGREYTLRADITDHDGKT